MLPLLLALTATAVELPDEIRDDATLVFGCSSMDALSAMQEEGGLASMAGAMAAPLQQVGMDASRPFWFVMINQNGQSLPGQFVFDLPPGQEPSPFLQMMPGAPRLQRDGQHLVVTLGGPPQASDGRSLSSLTQAASFEGSECVLAMDEPSDEGGSARLALSMGQGRAARVVLDTSNMPASPMQGGMLGGIGKMPQAGLGGDVDADARDQASKLLLQQLRDGRRPRRKAIGATVEQPMAALRLNMPMDLAEIAAAAMPKQTEGLEGLDKVEFEAGSEVALWRRPGGKPQVAVIALVKKPRTVRWWPGKLAKGAAKQGLQTERRGRVFGIKPEDRPWVWVAAKGRRLILAGDPTLVEQIRKKKVGDPWFEGTDPSAPGLVFTLTSPGGKAPTAGRLYMDGDLLIGDMPGVVASE